MSPVFSQNLYQGVYEHYEPQALPNELDLFNVDEEKFPLLAEVQEYILESTLAKGDCIFVPSMYFMQFQTEAAESTILGFEYQPSSKFVDLLYQAINEGLHKDD